MTALPRNFQRIQFSPSLCAEEHSPYQLDRRFARRPGFAKYRPGPQTEQGERSVKHIGKELSENAKQVDFSWLLLERCGGNNQALTRVGSMQWERNVGDTESC